MAQAPTYSHDLFGRPRVNIVGGSPGTDPFLDGAYWALREFYSERFGSILGPMLFDELTPNAVPLAAGQFDLPQT